MNSRVSWSVEGIEPSVRARAEAAARRAGMSLGDWLNAALGDASPFTPSRDQDSTAEASYRPLPKRDADEIAEIHHRLDAIARQIENVARPSGTGEPAVAQQLNDAISRLDARLSQISEPPRFTVRAAPEAAEATTNVYSMPKLSPLDAAIAEIAARQLELDHHAPRGMTQRSDARPPTGLEMSALNHQLQKITHQIDSLQRPDNIEQSIGAFRADLAEIRHVITEAMPRQAIESLEREIQSLSNRIDQTRHDGVDNQALAGVERALSQIHDTLRSLTPAEQLAGFEEAIQHLGGKIDQILRSSDNPGTLQQLEGAVVALRGIVSNVASNEALERLSQDVHSLSARVDQLAPAENYSESFTALEQRITALTETLTNRERPQAFAPSDHLEAALQALSDRLDNMPVGNDSASAYTHLEQRVTHLLERLESATSRGNDVSRIEDGLQDVLRHLERQQQTIAALAAPRAEPAGMDPGLIDTIKRELADMRFSQTETDRHTQDSLEVVHSTLGHVVDRLAIIEGDLRNARAAPPPTPAPAPKLTSAPKDPPPRGPSPVTPVAPPVSSGPGGSGYTSRPPKDSDAETSNTPHMRLEPRMTFDAAPREFLSAAAAPEQAAVPAQKPLREILSPPAASPRASHAVFDASLPPDHPLEPGTRPHARTGSPSERIAASEDALGDLSPAAPEPASASSFIAAARRAAQAAAAAPANQRTGAGPNTAPKPGSDPQGSSTISSKIRSLLVSAGVVVVVLGSFKMAMTLIDGDNQPRLEISDEMTEPLTQDQAEAEVETPAPAKPTMQLPPSMTSPTPLNRQVLTAPAESNPVASAPEPAPPGDVTGSIPPVHPAGPTTRPAASPPKLSVIPIPANEKLPEAIGGAALRTAALKGDATAAYEVGVRFSEGKGVPLNYDEAIKWYDRAAKAGVVPALFRLGTLYEKGLGVKKDLDVARQNYAQAAERGNAKAMHNLAVLDADGGARGPNYKSAAQWFRKAAERGVADSQFNLGILYARGIGIDQNLAESFKWFSLAAAQGDADAGQKRDDVAKRLDPQSLAAAKLAVQTFIAESQPDDAVNVATPAGGWDKAPAQTGAKAGKRAGR